MIELDLLIRNRLGLHARAASKFVHTACRYHSRIHVSKDGLCVDGKSILGMLSLAGSQGSTLRVRVEGEDEQNAARDLIALLENHFGEGA